MRSSKSPLTNALHQVVVPWAEREGFIAYLAYLMIRERRDIGAKEIIEVQRSNKYPYRMYTVNLGLFHPDYCEAPPSDPKELSSVHCEREVSIGHVINKSPWMRMAMWCRYGSGWDFLDLIPPYGDFWWKYGRSLEDTLPSVRNMLHHLADGGLSWFNELRRHTAIEQVFDPRNYAWYEMPGASSKGIDVRLKHPS
jgi:hypothetical protein